MVMMTPEQFFNQAINTESKYQLAKLAINIADTNDNYLLQLFITDLEAHAKKWQEQQREHYANTIEENYYSEKNKIEAFIMMGQISEKTADELFEELEEPLPAFFYDLPPVPENITWVINELKKFLDSTIPDELNPQIELNLPPQLDTPEARKYFGRCIEQGWMTLTEQGAKWNEPQVRLGYVCINIYRKPYPYTALESYFNIQKIAGSIAQAENNALTTKVKKWREEIDTKIFFE